MRPPIRKIPKLLPRWGMAACAAFLICVSAVFVFATRSPDATLRSAISTEFGHILGKIATLRDGADSSIRPDAPVVMMDPVVGQSDDGSVLSGSSGDTAISRDRYLHQQAEEAHLRLDKPQLSLDALTGFAAFDPDFPHTPDAQIDISNGVVHVTGGPHLTDVNLSIERQGALPSMTAHGDFVIGARRTWFELHLNDLQGALSDTGSQGQLAIRFETVSRPAETNPVHSDADGGMLAHVGQMIDDLHSFWRRPLTIEGQFTITPHAIRISDATLSHSGIALSGDLTLRARSDLEVLPQILVVHRSAGDALSHITGLIDEGRWANVPIDTGWMTDLEVELDLTGQDISAGGATIEAMSLYLHAHSSGLSLLLSSESETLGQFAAQTTMSDTGAVTISASLSGASVTSLSRPIARRMQARLIGSPQLPEGAISAQVQLLGEGATIGALSSSLSGTLEASLRDGSLSGGDVIATLQTLANGRQFMTKEKGPLIPAAGRTHFDAIDGQVVVKAGTAHISRLTIAGERLAIDMLGEVGLTSGDVDMVGKAQLSASYDMGADDIPRHVDLPFGIGGTVFAPMIAAGVPEFELAAHAPMGVMQE